MVLLEEATRQQLIEQLKMSFDTILITGIMEKGNGNAEQISFMNGDNHQIITLIEIAKHDIIEDMVARTEEM